MPRKGGHNSDSDQLNEMLTKTHDGEHFIIIQQVPFNLNGISPTTCRDIKCPEKDRVFKTGSLRASLEPAEQCLPSGNKYFLNYRAKLPIHKVLRSSSKSLSSSKRGLGAMGETWWCLRCLERIIAEADETISSNKADDLPKCSIQQYSEWIFPETRVIPSFVGKFTLRAPYVHAIELWKAVKRYDDYINLKKSLPQQYPSCLPVPTATYEGLEGESLYLNADTRDHRAHMHGMAAELSAEECRDKSLLAVMLRVEERIRELNDLNEVYERGKVTEIAGGSEIETDETPQRTVMKPTKETESLFLTPSPPPAETKVGQLVQQKSSPLVAAPKKRKASPIGRSSPPKAVKIEESPTRSLSPTKPTQAEEEAKEPKETQIEQPSTVSIAPSDVSVAVPSDETSITASLSAGEGSTKPKEAHNEQSSTKTIPHPNVSVADASDKTSIADSSKFGEGSTEHKEAGSEPLSRSMKTRSKGSASGEHLNLSKKYKITPHPRTLPPLKPLNAPPDPLKFAPKRSAAGRRPQQQ